jgi:cytochrome bd-type quinol oxidase subunit 2
MIRHPWISIASFTTGIVCLRLVSCDGQEEEKKAISDKFNQWDRWNMYVASQTCYVAAFIVTLVMSSVAESFAWEIACILPVLLVCAAMLEYMMTRHHSEGVRRVLDIECVFLVLLFAYCIVYFREQWPLHVLNTGSLYHNLVSERSFSALLDDTFSVELREDYKVDSEHLISVPIPLGGALV